MKELAKLFIQIGYKYKLRLSGIIAYSVLCGYCIPYWPIFIERICKFPSLHSQVFLIMIACMYFSFNYVKEFLLFDIYNWATYQLKLINVDNFHKDNLENAHGGKTIARGQRSTSSKYFMRYFVSIIKNITSIITSIFLICKIDGTLGIIIISAFGAYSSALYLIQKYYNILRKSAWDATEKEGEITAHSVDQTIAVRQNLFDNKSYGALKNEYLIWGRYYFFSNIYFVFLSIFSIGFLIISLIYLSKNILDHSLDSAKILFLIWNFINHIKNFTTDSKILNGMIIDLKIFFARNENHAAQNQHSVLINTSPLQNLNLKNVIINFRKKMIGPVNFDFECLNQKKQIQIIALTGANGIGKTSLGLAIANMIPFKGRIETPPCIYINTDTKNIDGKQISKGENAMEIMSEITRNQQIQKIELIIIDELLDNLSNENLDKTLKNLRVCKKTILIITHRVEIIKNADIHLNLLENGKIQII